MSRLSTVETGLPTAAAQPITDVAAPAKQNDDIPRGIVFMIAATVLFAVSSALAKWQVAIYPVGEVMFFRSFSSLVVCAAFILPFTGLSVFATQRPRDHIARGLSQSISQTFTVIAFSLMPLAGAIAINFSAPLWSALLSVIWLKERAGPVRWAGAARRISRRAHRHQSGRGFAAGRRAVRARQRRDVRQRHRRGARHDGDRIRQHAADVADGDDRVLPRFPAGVRLPLADAARRRDAGLQRRRQRDRAIFLDAGAASRAGDGGVAVLSISCWCGRW